MSGSTGKKSTPLSLESVRLSDRDYALPVARLGGTSDGPALLITAGNDGDEYAGIKASYSIIEEFSHTSFSGSLTVLPVVNMPGFSAERSENPLDGRYPKHVYPGRETGSPTEQLRYWMSGFVRQADFWMDLHGGSLTERVNPYVHAWKSADPKTDETVLSAIHAMSVPNAVFQASPDPVRRPGPGDCGYIMCESGSFCDVSDAAVSRHISWIRTVMRTLGMIHGRNPVRNKRMFSGIYEYSVHKHGLWVSAYPADNRITRGMTLGVVRSFDGTLTETVTAKQDGILLWAKEGMRAASGDTIAGVGY